MLANAWIISENCLKDSSHVISADAIVFLGALIEKKLPFVILTSDHMKTKQEITMQYQQKGIQVNESNIFHIADAACQRLYHLYPHKSNACFIGGKGLEEAIRQTGYTINWEKPDWAFLSMDKNATYDDYSYLLNLMKKNTKLVVVENDFIQYVNDTYRLGTESIAHMLEVASNEKPVRIVMPEPMILGEALSHLKHPKENAIFVTSDIKHEVQCANRAQIDSVFVSASMSQQETIDIKEISPTYIVENLLGLLR